MCLIEEPRSGNALAVDIAIITLCPSTGDVVWDDFEGDGIICYCTYAS
jgi:DNA mismatch repair protein MSH3